MADAQRPTQQWVNPATNLKKRSQLQPIHRSSLTSLLLLLMVLMLAVVKQAVGWGLVILLGWGAIELLGRRLSPNIRRLFNLTLCLFCLTLMIEQPQPEATKDFDLPAPASLTALPTHSLWATYYYLHQGQAIENGIPLLDLAENPVGAALSPQDWCIAAVQGSLQVLKKTTVIGTYNFAGVGPKAQTDCAQYYPRLQGVDSVSRTRFSPTAAAYGEGVKGYQLVPYRTIAVDETVIPIGSILYIPVARGIKITLPSGDEITHDGYFYAADVGGAVHDNHIDVFTGLTASNPFPFVKSQSSATFDAYVIDTPSISAKLAPQHRWQS